MADKITGWYPDPGGATDRYRYWDGTTWSAATTDDPRDPAPGGYSIEPSRRSRLGVIIGLLTVLAIMVIAGSLLVGNPRPQSDPLPTATVSGGDDTTPSEPAEPTPQDSSSAPSAEPSSICRRGNPDRRSPHPDDGRVYGGNLSFAPQRTFDPADAEPRLSFAWDVTEQMKIVSQTPGWIAQLAVGQLRAADFRRAARATAEQVAECLVTGDMYGSHHAARRDLRSEAITIDARHGWLIESDITVTEPGLKFAGDRVIIVVVRDGENWGLFFGAVPIGDARLAALLDQTVEGLRAG